MASLNQTNDILDATISDIVAKFNEGTISTEKNVFNKVLDLVRGLDLDSQGNLKQTQNNIKILNKVRANIEPIVLNDAYKKRVKDFTKGFKDVEKINSEYLTTISKGFQPSSVLQNQIMAYEVDVTVETLARSGIKAEVIEPVKKMIQNAVLNGGGFGDLIDELREEIKGIPDVRGGSMSRYVNQIAHDSLHQYQRNYTITISKDLGYEWYYYSGGLKSTSRSYCKKRAGRHFHIEEIEDSASLKWPGKIKGTNESNILRYCGGYNCGHRYLPIDEKMFRSM